jgi:hypothetical protein
VEGVALVKWKNVSRPNIVEHWGLKNIYQFGKGLVAKSSQ